MNFEFATATKIIFGNGSSQQLPDLCKHSGSRVLVVTGSKPDRFQKLLDSLQNKDLLCSIFSFNGEPDIDLAERALTQAREFGPDVVIGIGGGSVIDLGKIVAAMLTNKGELLDYCEVIGRGKSISHQPLPYIAVPTTAGTGAEVTKNGVLASRQENVKVSIRSPLMFPRIALVDPLLTHSMPPAVTASTGLDCLTQLIEAFVTHATNPMTDALCREGIPRAITALPIVYADGLNETARTEMALASMFSGIVLANAKLGAVHGFAAVIGGMYNAPHGAICARLLPSVLKANVTILSREQPESPLFQRFQELATLLANNTNNSIEEAIESISQLCEEFHIPRLSDIGVLRKDFPLIVQKALKSSSMRGNPVMLSPEILMNILVGAL